MERPAQILGLGASTPIGRNVWFTAAAARAGICGFSEHPFVIDSAGEPMRVARAPWLDIEVEGVARFCELLFPAIDEALDPVRAELERGSSSIGLGLAMPPSRPGRPVELRRAMLERIEDRYAELFSRTWDFETGHAGALQALDEACRARRGQTLDGCLVAGVDSYLDPETLEWVEECDQLHGGGHSNNAWGFIPGEGAGAVLVTSSRLARRVVGGESVGEIVSVGIGREEHRIKTEAVCTGKGLTEAFQGALQGLSPEEQVHNVFCDLNGEAYRSDEYGFTALRTKERFVSPTDFVAPADCWGDLGAAGAPLHIALGLICHRKRYGNGPLSMVWASSESGERGAVLIRASDPMGR